MKVIAISGICGGVGGTTVAAQLAACLVAHNQQVIAFDFSPQNALRLHFGMAWEDGSGIVPQIQAGQPWSEAAYRSGSGVDFLPFGNVTPQDASEFTARLAQQPGWLPARLREIDGADNSYVIIDCPQTGHVLCAQARAAADLMIVVVEPDTLSYAAFTGDRSRYIPGEKQAVYLINGFDPVRALDRDITRLMRVTPDNNLCPIVIHRDELVREALANKASVADYAPHSQAAGDFFALTTWVVATFSHAHSVS
ncbi:MAG: cellulose biosynthesis protein BcsQ [Pseudomonadota bacterium]